MTLEHRQAEPESQAPGRWRGCIVAFLVVGVGLRVWRAVFAGLPMRIDEIRVAVNLQARSYAELALPLDHQQGAPVGFLWLSKLAVQVLGDHDAAYRLVPLLAGIGVVVLMPWLARQVVGRPGTLLATGLVALSPWAIQYSSDFKPYAMDALATAGVLLAAVLVRHPKTTGRSLAAFAGVGALALVLSHAAMFVTAAAGLTLGAAALYHRQTQRALQLVGVAIIWAGTFALLWFINLRHISGRDDLMDFWDQDFMPLPPTNPQQWGWYARAPMEWLNTSGYYFHPVVLILVALGFWALRRKPAIAGLVLGPVILTLAACAARQYPFANRMIAFLMPATLLLLALGFEQAVRWGTRLAAMKPAAPSGRTRDGAAAPRPGVQRRPSRLALYAGVVLALFCFVTTLPFSQINRPWMGGRFDIVRPMRVVQHDRREADLILMGNALWWPYIHRYAPQMGLPHAYDERRFLNQRMPRDPADADADLLRARLAQARGQRVWVFAADGIWMGHHPKWPTLGEMHDTRAPTRQVLEQEGTIQQQHDYANVSVYLWVADEEDAQ